MYQKRFDIQFRGKDVQVWNRGSLSLVRMATLHNVSFELRKAGFKDGDIIELTLRKASEEGKKTKKKAKSSRNDPPLLEGELE